jgi:hemerythrin
LGKLHGACGSLEWTLHQGAGACHQEHQPERKRSNTSYSLMAHSIQKDSSAVLLKEVLAKNIPVHFPCQEAKMIYWSYCHYGLHLEIH